MSPRESSEERSGWLRIVLRIVVALALAWHAALGLLYVLQRQLVFRPDRERVAPSAVGLGGFAEETLTTPDGARIIAWWAPPRPGRPVVLYFHGNGGNISYRAGRYGLMRDAGFGVLALSWRGYGGSTGSPSEVALVADGRLAWRHLVAKGIESERIVIFGESLGSGVAVQVAAAEKVAGVILDSPFTSVADVAAWRFPFLPVHGLVWDRFDSLTRIADIGVPLLIVHGDRDRVVPYSLGRRLHEAARQPKRFVTLAGAGHTAPLAAGAWSPVREFLDAVGR